MNVDDLHAALHATLINATAAAADAALQPNSAPMRQEIADLLAHARGALDALPGDGDNVVSIL